MNSKDLEKSLWATAKKVRNKSDSFANIHTVLGLIFLRCITDVFNNPAAAANTQNHEEYLAYNEYFVPHEAQWDFLQSNAGKSDIGELIDDAIQALEKLNKNLKGIFSVKYADPAVDKSALAELIGLIGNAGITKQGNKKKLPLVHAFEYLLEMFAAEGKTGDQSHTPEDVARLLVEMAEPRQGVIYDGCCGTGSMFIQSIQFIKKYRGSLNDLKFYGQDSNASIIKIARMNLIIHGADADLQAGDTFTNDCYPGLRADFILGTPPFNQGNWKGEQLTNDKRWEYGTPPAGNANYAWLQHSIAKLGPTGTVGIVLANSSINANGGEERKIRKNLIEARLVDCIVVLPSNLFYNNNTPVCLWLLAKNKTNNNYRNSGNEILFIDARKLSVRSSRRKRELTDEMILLISRTYHRWRNINGDYTDLKGFCKTVPIETVSKNSYSLQPQKYVADKRVRNILAAVLLIIFLGILYFVGFKNGLFIRQSQVVDTTLTVRSKIVRDSSLPKNENKTAKKKEKNKPLKADDSVINPVAEKPVDRTPTVNKDIPAEAKADTNASVSNAVSNKPIKVSNKPAKETTTAERNMPEEVKGKNEGISYKVISKAYFYNEPDEKTQRRAYITHWNNSYADIRALDEKNGFIYVVFTNHLHQRSKGWLRKKDLKEANQ